MTNFQLLSLSIGSMTLPTSASLSSSALAVNFPAVLDDIFRVPEVILMHVISNLHLATALKSTVAKFVMHQ